MTKTELNKEVQDKLLIWRKDNYFTQAQAAEVFNVSIMTWQKWETAMPETIKIEKLRKMCKVIGYEIKDTYKLDKI